MGSQQSVIAAWVIVGFTCTVCVVVLLRFILEVCFLRRQATYRVSTIIISRTSLEDLQPPPISLSAASLAALGIPVNAGDVCFLAVDRAPLAPGEEPCFICCESAVVDIAGPCGHGGMCGACFTRVWAYPDAKCPICRGVPVARPSPPQLQLPGRVEV